MFRRMITVVAAGLFAACASQPERVASTTEMGGPVVGAGEEMEVLVTNVGEATVKGEVAIRPTAENQTFLSIAIEGSESGAVHPWHLHQGDCDDAGGIVGAPAAYAPISVDAEGEGEARATIDPVVRPDGDYSVKVHKSPSELGTIVACGDVQAN